MKTFYSTLISCFLTFIFISCEKIESESAYSYLDEPGFVSDGLIGYYPFNGDLKDYSGNGNHAVASNPTFAVDRFYNSGGSIQLNGIDDDIVIPEIGKLFVNNEGTIFLWSKTDISSMRFDKPRPVILSFADSINACLFITSEMGAGELPLNYLAYYHGMYPNLGGGTMSGLEHGGFVLIAISLRDSGISIYELMNGTFRNSSMSTMGNSFGFNRDRTNQDLYLGKSIIDTMETDIGGWDFLFTYFKGEMDDLIIYDRVLKDEEIMHLFNLIGKYN